MKTRWQEFSPRERSSISLGSILLIFITLYFLVWSPLVENIDTLHTEIAHDRQLVSWMASAVPEIKSLQKIMSTPKQQPHTRLDTIVQQALQNNHLSGYSISFTPAIANQLQLSFKQAPFDQLSQFLVSLWLTDRIEVTEFTLHALHASGVVQADISLTSKALDPHESNYV